MSTLRAEFTDIIDAINEAKSKMPAITEITVSGVKVVFGVPHVYVNDKPAVFDIDSICQGCGFPKNSAACQAQHPKRG